MKGVQELNYKFLMIKLDDNRDRWVFIKIGSTTLFTLHYYWASQKLDTDIEFDGLVLYEGCSLCQKCL